MMRVKFLNTIGLLLISTLVVTNHAQAQEPLSHLIQTSGLAPKWMSPSEINKIIEEQHSLGKCGGFMDVTHQDWDNPLFDQPYSPAFGILGLNKILPTEQKTVVPLLTELSAQELEQSVSKLSSYPNRYYKSQAGQDSALWIKSQFEALSKNRTDVSVSTFTHKRFNQPSIIATIQGKGQNANEIIVLGAHEDSINMILSRGAPGADDNASGVATLLEVFRVLMDSGFQPDRTLQFMTYAAEEVGLLGSQDIAASYRKFNKNVVAVLQFDMTMFASPGRETEMTLITDYTDRTLNQFTKMLIDEYVKIKWHEDECGYACSDHVSWTKAGYASTFPFETRVDEYNRKTHTAKDTLEQIDPNFGLYFAKFGLAFAIEMTKGI